MEVRKARDVGRLIRARRRQLGWTQATLAARAQTTRRWISEVEHGKPTAEIGLVLATLRALGVILRVETNAVGDRRARSRTPRPAQPSVAELTDLLEQHVEDSAPGMRRLSFLRTHH